MTFPTLEPEAEGFNPFAPLTHFKGTLKSIAQVDKTGKQSGSTYTVVKFVFDDVEVIQSREVYPFKTADGEIGYRRRGLTEWNVLAASIKAKVGGDNIADLLNRRQEWKYIETPINRRNPANGKYEDLPGFAWVVTDVEGLASTGNGTGEPIWSELAPLFDGKTVEEATQILYNTPEIKTVFGFQEAVNAALNGKLVEKLTTTGLMKEKDGILAKV